MTKKSIQQHISDLITDRLKTALKKEDESSMPQPEQPVSDQVIEEKSKVNTTDEEIEGFMIVKTLLRQKVNPSRVTYRDAQSYFAILLDDNNRKTICRLYLNGSKKYVAVLDDQKKEVRNEINVLDDIFKFSDQLNSIVETYDKSKEVV